MEPKTIKIDNVEYVRKDSFASTAEPKEGMQYCIVRTYSAGVFAGYVKDRAGKEATILNARRLWRWSGAASLSQLAIEGTSKPEQCKFPCETIEETLTEVIEVILCTEKAKKSIAEVKVWSE